MEFLYYVKEEKSSIYSILSLTHSHSVKTYFFARKCFLILTNMNLKQHIQVKVPVIVAGCKLDLRDEQQPVSLEQVMSPIMQQFREIETCIECSAYKHIQVRHITPFFF